MPGRLHFVEERATPYPRVKSFFETFNDEMHSLYLLSFLLTADHDKAEQCLVSTMGECVEGITVFTDRAHSWTRRAVFKHAIRMINPSPEPAVYISLILLKGATLSADNDPFALILLLDDFERFVFVMSILDGQSDEECATLLRCSRCDVIIARVLALKRQSSMDALAGEIPQS